VLVAATSNPPFSPKYTLFKTTKLKETKPSMDTEDPNAQCLIGMRLLATEDDEKAVEGVRWLRRAAEQGHTEAMYRLALSAMLGRGMPRDTDEGLRYHQLAAQRGHNMSQCIVGLLYLGGHCGLPRDERRALVLLKLSAAQDNAEAICQLGLCMHEGIGVPKDLEGSVRLLRRAAEKNHPRALHALGSCYMYGEGVPVDDQTAMYFFQRAADLGEPRAVATIQLLNQHSDGVPPRW